MHEICYQPYFDLPSMHPAMHQLENCQRLLRSVAAAAAGHWPLTGPNSSATTLCYPTQRNSLGSAVPNRVMINLLERQIRLPKQITEVAPACTALVYNQKYRAAACYELRAVSMFSAAALHADPPRLAGGENHLPNQAVTRCSLSCVMALLYHGLAASYV